MAAPTSEATTEFTIDLLLGHRYEFSANGTGGVWYEPTIGTGITADQINCVAERKSYTIIPTADETMRVWRGGTLEIQIEDTTGQSNSNPAEYVSVGILSGDFHGLGVDGVAAYEHENGNTTAGNVVTEAKGPLLTTDWKALYELAATNYADGADDLSGGAETVDLTSGGTGDFTLSVKGTAAVTVAAGTATGTGFGQATEGNPVTFNLSVTGTVTLTLDSGTLDKLNGLALKQVEGGSKATSFILTNGGTGNRTADDGSPSFDFANFNQSSGTRVARVKFGGLALGDEVLVEGVTGALLNALTMQDGTMKSFDGTGTSVSPSMGADASKEFYVAVNYANGQPLDVGFRNITDAGSWQWTAAPVTFDGAFPTDNNIHAAFGATVSLEIRDLDGYLSAIGKSQIEATY